MQEKELTSKGKTRKNNTGLTEDMKKPIVFLDQEYYNAQCDTLDPQE